MKYNKRILECLLENGYILKQDLISRIDSSERTGKGILDLLIEDKILSWGQLLEIYEKEWGFEIYNPQKHLIDRNVVNCLPIDYIQSNEIFPLNQCSENELAILMSDPTQVKVIGQVRQAVNKNIKIMVASKPVIKNLIGQYYYQKEASKKTINLEETRKKNSEIEKNTIDRVNELIQEGVIRGASDIHIEPYQKYCRIRLRIDGRLEENQKITRAIWKNFSSRIKVMGACDIGEHHIPQDGSFQISFHGRPVNIRLSVIPTIHGEKLVLRLLDQQQFLYALKDLGFSFEQKKQVDDLLKIKQGMLLISGPTGSGKTTTLYSLINAIKTMAGNFVTIEDPVEFQLEGINQIQVNEKAGINFANGLRAILRQDPDVIMVGEIRDEETAALATRAAITGHLLLSSIHTSNTVSSITRLMDMKVPLYLLSAALRGIISQKLIPKLCSHCRKKRPVSETERAFFQIRDAELYIYDRGSCPMCHQSGYQGRVAVQEVLKMTKAIRQAIEGGENYDGIRKIALAQGLIPFSESVLSQMFAGKIASADGIAVLIDENEWNQ